MDDKRAILINKLHWESMNKIHKHSKYYVKENFNNYQLTLSKEEIDDLGNIAGYEAAHLQCGYGLDTITLSRLGASMTGFDISSNSITEAKNNADKFNASISFIQSDIYEINQSHFGKFDFVYTSHGVLRWLPNLDLWAMAIVNLLKPGGMFYIFEIHPLVYYVHKIDAEGIYLCGEYFDEKIKLKKIDSSHAGHVDESCASEVAHTNWSMKSIFQSLLNAGLIINKYNEFSGCSYSRKNIFPNSKNNLWYPTVNRLAIPLSFSIKAFKPQEN